MRGVARAVRSFWEWLREFPILDTFRSSLRFLISQRYREDLAHRHLQSRLDVWQERGQLSPFSGRQDPGPQSSRFSAPSSALLIARDSPPFRGLFK